jgi:hypothetical protein
MKQKLKKKKKNRNKHDNFFVFGKDKKIITLTIKIVVFVIKKLTSPLLLK